MEVAEVLDHASLQLSQITLQQQTLGGDSLVLVSVEALLVETLTTQVVDLQGLALVEMDQLLLVVDLLTSVSVVISKDYLSREAGSNKVRKQVAHYSQSLSSTHLLIPSLVELLNNIHQAVL